MRDAGSATVALQLTNTWRVQDGITYNKAYNLHKDLFTTPMKGVRPFQLPQLEGLGYAQKLLDEWYEKN